MKADSETISIRPLTPGDFDAVSDLWQSAKLAVKTTGRESRGAFEHQLAKFPTSYLAAVAGGRLVGVVLGSHDHRKGWINRLAVHPQHQRRGLGLALLRACEEALRADGIEIVAAFVESGNEPSRRLFEQGGYVADVPVRYYRKRHRSDI
ncbi:MAG: GNAT family N-acetyltransferase [Planctomycetota bacterium]|jgi:ribosomal protein S18 acetylase RimI-like enzyme